MSSLDIRVTSSIQLPKSGKIPGPLHHSFVEQPPPEKIADSITISKTQDKSSLEPLPEKAPSKPSEFSNSPFHVKKKIFMNFHAPHGSLFFPFFTFL